MFPQHILNNAHTFKRGHSITNVNKNNFVRFEVFMAVTVKNSVFWDVTPCRYCVNRHLEEREDEDNTFLRNVGLHSIYMVPHPKRRHSSKIILFICSLISVNSCLDVIYSLYLSDTWGIHISSLWYASCYV
jgi:hypothetical protein